MSLSSPNKKSTRIIVTVPATTANFGAGFDIFGAALELRNTLIAGLSQQSSLPIDTPPTITIEGEGENELPRNGSNLIWKTMLIIFKKLKIRRHPIKELKLINRIPLSSGLGSSAAAIVGGIFMANEVANSRISRQELIDLAVQLEGHPDNVVPAVVGGFCICCDGKDGKNGHIFYLRLPLPRTFKAIVTVPYGINYTTRFARKILPEKIAIKDVVYNLSRSALLPVSLTCKNSEFHRFIKESMTDRIHQPERLSHIPGASEAMIRALKAGALGVALSGSGPSLLALSNSPDKSFTIARALERGFASKNISSRSFILNFVSASKSGVEIKKI